jgi:hypothetical protein
MSQQRVHVDRLAPSPDPRQIRVILRRTQTKRCRNNRRNKNRYRSRRDLPERNRPFLLDLRMRRKILKWKNVTRWQADNGFGFIATSQFVEPLQQRNQILGSAVIGNNQDERTPNRSLLQDQKQCLRRGSESTNTCPPRALAEKGDCTQKGG